MKIQVITSIADGVSDEPEVFVNNEDAALLRYQVILKELGYDGDGSDVEDVDNFLSDLESDELHLYEFDLPLWLSVETIETLQAVEGWAKQYSPPDFARLVKAIEEVKAAL